MIKGAIFDMDGLMIDTEKLLVKYWCEAANEYGFPMQREHALTLRSLARKFAIPYLQGIFGESFDYQTVRNRRMELMKAYIDEHGIEKKKGLDELLIYLKSSGYKIALATATDINRAGEYLNKIGVYNYFDKIVCASMVESGKPSPDIYLKAAESLALAPQECIALEDSPNGITSAFRAGCKTIMIPDLTQPDKKLSEMLFAKCESLDKVIDVLKSQ